MKMAWEVIPQLDSNKIMLKILVGLALAFYQSIYLPFVAQDRDAWKLQVKQLLPRPPQG